jgi:hypothetical protein
VDHDPPSRLAPAGQAQLDAILDACPELAAVTTHVRGLAAMMTSRRGRDLEKWMTSAAAAGDPALSSFVTGLRADQDAVTAALTLPWSSGAVEGHVNWIKMPKRQMYGRASPALLRSYPAWLCGDRLVRVNVHLGRVGSRLLGGGVRPELPQDTENGLAVVLVDSCQQLLVEPAVRPLDLVGCRLAGFGQGGQGVAVVRGIRASRQQALGLELLDQAGDGGSVCSQAPPQLAVAGLALPSEPEQGPDPGPAEARLAGEPLLQFEGCRPELGEERVVGVSP